MFPNKTVYSSSLQSLKGSGILSEMYKKFNTALLNECGIDFEHYLQTLRAAGNETGIYSDVALLLYKLVAHSYTKTVLEFGSGMSTCIMGKSSNDHNKHLITMEHLRKWYNVTSNCMSSLKIDVPGYICTDSDITKFSKVVGPVEMAWIDGPIAFKGPRGEDYGRFDSCNVYKDNLESAVLLFDDAQSLPKTEEFIISYGRDPKLNLWFNPTERTDRQVLISFPTVNHPLREVVEYCNLKEGI